MHDLKTDLLQACASLRLRQAYYSPKIKYLSLLFLMIISLLAFSCIFKPPVIPVEPGSRNYVWEIDTLYMPMNYISSVWGASPDDLWAVGGGGTKYDRLLHYNGTSWSTYTNEVISCTAYTLFGFSEDNIWMGGGAEWPDNGGAIWHYDGQKWEKYFIYNPDEDFHGIQIRYIWGDNPDNVYACGYRGFFDGINSWFKGFVLHYNGNEWSEIVRVDFNSQFLGVSEEDDNVYIFSFGLNNDGADTLAFYSLNNDTLHQIYSSNESIIHWAGMTNINEKVYFAIDNDVYLYSDEVLNKYISINYDYFYWKVFGRNERDIFFLMRDGYVHYNGTNMQYIYKLPSTDMRFIGEPLIIEDNVYYCLYYPGSDELILHGKLEDNNQE